MTENCANNSHGQVHEYMTLSISELLLAFRIHSGMDIMLHQLPFFTQSIEVAEKDDQN